MVSDTDPLPPVKNEVRGEPVNAPLVRFDVFSLFPAMFEGPLRESILRRARERGLVEIGIHDLRAWTTDRHRTADDTPYGGGAGMVMLAPPIIEGVEAVVGSQLPETKVIVLSAAGRVFNQTMARALAANRRVVLICGHYEGIDERAVEVLDADLLSIGDYVLTGGELPAMVVIDAVARLVPGVIDVASVAEESHDSGLVEYPHYTRPAMVRGRPVPDILLSGHHARISKWRREQAVRRTALWRPDLLADADLSAAERRLVAEIGTKRQSPDEESGTPATDSGGSEEP